MPPIKRQFEFILYRKCKNWQLIYVTQFRETFVSRVETLTCFKFVKTLEKENVSTSWILRRIDFASTRRAISIKLEIPRRLAAVRCARIGVVAFVHTSIGLHERAPRITASALRIYWVHFPLTRDSARQVRILMRHGGARARRSRKAWARARVCVCVCAREYVGSWESGCREFGGPYINQFHYHRDQGVSGFSLRATPRDFG